MRNIRTGLIILVTAMLVSGCVGAKEALKGMWGTSTKVLEDGGKDAIVKVFRCSYRVCYMTILKNLKSMPGTSIYDRNRQMIALYYIDPNTTPVGIFFKRVDAGHTQVEVSSPAKGAKETVANYVFSKVIPKGKVLRLNEAELWRR